MTGKFLWHPIRSKHGVEAFDRGFRRYQRDRRFAEERLIPAGIESGPEHHNDDDTVARMADG